jgi:tetratricopeptide (TPR) repeat protein
VEIRPAPDLQGFDLSLAPPDGFDRSTGFDSATLAVPLGVSPEVPEVSWASTALPVAGPDLDGGLGGPLSFGPVSRPPTGDAALEDALVEADVFRRYGLLEKAVDQLRPLLERDPANLRVREKLFEIHLEQGNRDEARTHAAILAEAYGASGREDRIRGLAALLGEPVREATPEPGEARAPLPVAATAPAEAAFEQEVPEVPPPLGEPAREEPAPEQVTPGVALPADLSLGDLEIAADFAEPMPVVSAGPVALEFPAFAAEGLEEPPTEVISAVVPPPSALVEVVPEALPEEPAPLAFEPELPAEAAAAAPEAPAPALEVPAEPEPAPPGEPATPAPSALPERRATPKTKLSTEDILGLGKAGAPPVARTPKAVRPEDVELDLLGAKPPRAKAKAPSRPEVVLPDDLLRSLRKPAPATAAATATTATPLPATPAEPVPPEPVPLEPAVATPFEESPVPAAEVGAAAPGEFLEEVAIPSAEPAQASPEELSELDFCLDQGMVVDAAERLQTLEGRFPGDPELAARRMRLEGGRGGAEAPRTALHDILSDDLDSVLDASLGKALTEDMVRDHPPTLEPAPAAAAGAPVLDESGLFSDEQEFFNFADELHTELRREGEGALAEEGREVSLEEIFRDFKKGVEQQLSPEDYETHYNLGIAYKEMGLTDEAIGEFQLAAKDPLHAVECCAMLGLCFLEKGLPQLAVKWYRKGLETIGVKEDDRLGLQYALAGVFEQIGDREGAYRTYLDIFGSNAHYRDVPARLNELKPFAPS